MAKATRIDPKPVKQPPPKYVLELSEGEADFILGITASIGGSSTNSPRKYSDALRDALMDATGISAFDTDAYALKVRGAINFADYSDL